MQGALSCTRLINRTQFRAHQITAQKIVGEGEPAVRIALEIMKAAAAPEINQLDAQHSSVVLGFGGR